MKIGLWNIDHPETHTGSKSKQNRFDQIFKYLLEKNCDIYVLTEANIALQLPGYNSEFSANSPFKAKHRHYGQPNSYHQVGIYSKINLNKVSIFESINGLKCIIPDNDIVECLYGNVVTIKDRWLDSSDLKYSDRLKEQVAEIYRLPDAKTIVAGDFNLKLGWSQKQSSYNYLADIINKKGWVWPTKESKESVLHVLHSSDLKTSIEIDHSVKESNRLQRKLSDHPFIRITVLAS